MARPWCFYYVQGEEGESPEEPNAFQIAGAGGATLKQFLASFPLSRGPGAAYHFRFKVRDPALGFGWQDVKDPESPLPLWEDGSVHCKALRLDQRPLRPVSRLRRKPMLLGRAGSVGGGVQRAGSVGSTSSSNGSPAPSRAPPSSPATAAAPTTPAATRQPCVGATTTPAGPSTPGGAGVGRASSAPSTPQHRPTPTAPPTRTPSVGSVAKAAAPAPATESFFDTSDAAPAPAPAPTRASRPPAPPVAGADLDSFLYGGRPPTASTASSTPQRPPATGAASTPPVRGSASGSPAPPTGGMAGLDIDGDDDAAVPPSARGGSPVPPQQAAAPSRPPASEEEAFFAQTATAEEIAAKKEEREQEAIRVKYVARLEEWATDPMTKKPRNVRTLLSTMHTVLWEGCTWKAVSLGDLMMPDRVKFHYRKAMLVLHPDKNVNGSAEQRFISEKVFTSVNEAYNVFAAQELK